MQQLRLPTERGTDCSVLQRCRGQIIDSGEVGRRKAIAMILLFMKEKGLMMTEMGFGVKEIGIMTFLSSSFDCVFSFVLGFLFFSVVVCCMAWPAALL